MRLEHRMVNELVIVYASNFVAARSVKDYLIYDSHRFKNKNTVPSLLFMHYEITDA